MKRLKRFALLGLLLLLVCLSGFLMANGKHPAGEQPVNRVIRIGVLRVPNDVTTARQTGLLKKTFEKRGYRAQFVTFDSGVDANKALMSNSIDVATMGDTNAVVAMAAHLPAKLVWVNDVIGSNEQLVVQKSSGIHHWQDLKGKKIATPFASTSHYSLMMLLKKHHLLGKVDLVDMQTEEIVAAWHRGDIDGAYTWEPSLSNLNQRVKLADSQNLARQGRLTANVTLASNRFIKQHPQVLRAFVNCLARIHDDYRHDPQMVYRSTAANLKLSPQATKKQIGTARWVPSRQMAAFTDTTFTKQFYAACQFMCDQQTLNSTPSYADCCRFVTSEFMPREGLS
jgi:taurine transport system substrate-binding protein